MYDVARFIEANKVSSFVVRRIVVRMKGMLRHNLGGLWTVKSNDKVSQLQNKGKGKFHSNI